MFTQLFFVLGWFALYAEPDAAGRLLSAPGTWTRDDPSRGEVRPGIVVYAGEKFRAAKGVTKNAEFILYSGRPFFCSPVADCEIPNEKPATQGWLDQMRKKPDPLPMVASALARGGDVSDAVLLYQNGTLDISPAFESLDGTRYRIVLRNLRRTQEPIEFEYEWQRRGAKPAVVIATSGLFELTAITPERAELGPAVVYIADPRSYPEARQNLQEARALIAAAQPPISEVARRQLVLAVLDSQP